MRGAVLHGPRDVRFEGRPAPAIVEPTDAINRTSAACVCGAVRNVKRGQFVVGSFFSSDNTCPICQAGYQSRCVRGEFATPTGAQAPYLGW